MSMVDANIILRYILDDHAELSPKAAEILEQQTATLPIEAACEVVYVLQKVYTVDRKTIQQQLTNCKHSVPLFGKEGLGEILLDKSPSIPLFQRGK